MKISIPPAAILLLLGAAAIVPGSRASGADAPNVPFEIAGVAADSPAAITDLEKLIAEREARISELDAKRKETDHRLSLVRKSLDLLDIVSGDTSSGSAALSFNRDIRPILSDKCFACHGFDEKKRKSALRLDDGLAAFRRTPSGVYPIIAGDPAGSEVWKRITTEDHADRMPPADAGKQLTTKEVELIRRWIQEGAIYDDHWAFIPPDRPRVPHVRNRQWPSNEADRFILARLEREGLSPSPEADRRTLIRRATFDLTGLPPTIGEVEAFVNDASPDAWESVVDRLLASPRYGEHMARSWLDAARYADTNGYHIDNERYMWRWRDWVINAFNENKPYDEFTIEQLAGDLLPEPTRDQLVATGFNRNHMINFEGGAIPEEYRTQYVIDRVSTTSTIWLGLTVQCAQCHDHKFDPVTQKEFFQLYSFFNTIPENGLDGQAGNAAPTVQAPTSEDEVRLAKFIADIAAAEKKLDEPIFTADINQRIWEKKWEAILAERWKPLDPSSFASSGGSELTKLEDGSILAAGTNPADDTYTITAETHAAGLLALRLEAIADASLPDKGSGRAPNANFVLSEFEAEVTSIADPAKTEKLKFVFADADHSQDKFDIAQAIDGKPDTGWASEGFKRPETRTAIFVADKPFGYEGGTRITARLVHSTVHKNHGIGRARLSVSSDPTLGLSTLSGDWLVNGPYPEIDGAKAFRHRYAPEKELDLEGKYADGKAKWLRVSRFADGAAHALDGGVGATYLYREINSPSRRTMTLSLGSDDAIKVWVNDRIAHALDKQRGVKPGEDAITVDLEEGKNDLLIKIVNYGGATAFAFDRGRETVGEVPADVEAALLIPSDSRKKRDQRTIRDYFRRNNSPEWKELERELADLRKEKEKFEAAIPTVMVMKEMEKPRETFILARGQYDQPEGRVEPALPAVLPPMPEGVDATRLGLARWLTHPDHPLTARVTVNRIWKRFFGTGLVKTIEDFGAQGEWPSHPDLLDWLAREFVDTGWDLKAFQKMIMMSSAYRASSVMTPELRERDPGNRLIARGSRYRFDAEVIRDNALSVAGILEGTIGGPSVKPYQPKGIWEEVAYGGNFTAQRFEADKGEALWRRSMYTFWKRQAPPPSMNVFDAPNRETCTVNRERSNTPLQALTLMNDVQFVEAARMMAERLIREGGATPEARIDYAFRLAVARPAREAEVAVLSETLAAQLAEFGADEAAAASLLKVGDKPRDESLPAAEVAAWTTIASMILNLDETITRG